MNLATLTDERLIDLYTTKLAYNELRARYESELAEYLKSRFGRKIGSQAAIDTWNRISRRQIVIDGDFRASLRHLGTQTARAIRKMRKIIKEWEIIAVCERHGIDERDHKSIIKLIYRSEVDNTLDLDDCRPAIDEILKIITFRNR